MATQAVRKWECVVCGYIHEGPVPPDECPLCGAPRSEFKPCQPSTSPQLAAGASEPIRVVVIGTGHAGLSAASTMRSASSAAQITLVSDESHPPYQRLNLTRYLAGELSVEQLPQHPATWYEEHNLSLLLGRKVERVDLGRQCIALDDGRTIPFDKLILATGATAIVPPIPGANADDVRCLRTLDDAQAILGQAKPGARCVCIGGGILGLEAAGALARRGVEVTVIEGQKWLLSRQLNERAARVLEKHVAKLGIRLCHGAGVARIVGEGRAHSVELQDGSSLPADFVILATGVKPSTDLARQCGLTVNRGVVVNDRLETSDPRVLAAGDVAEYRGTVHGLWTVSGIQGHIAGLNAIGQQTDFHVIPRSNFLKVLDVDLLSIGEVEAGIEDRVIEQEPDGGYLRFVFRGSRLIGAVLLGDTRSATPVISVVERGLECTSLLKDDPSAANVLTRLESLSAL